MAADKITANTGSQTESGNRNLKLSLRMILVGILTKWILRRCSHIGEYPQDFPYN